MKDSDNHSPTPTLSRVHSSESLLRVGGELRTQGGSEETLSETIRSTRPEILGESPKNVPRHGENKDWQKYTVRLLLINTAVGTLFAVIHHFLYEILSHEPTLAVSHHIGPVTVGPMWALTVGNGLSWLVQLFLTSAIGAALIQRFWHLVHKHHFTLHEMDRIFGITSSFSTRTALRRATGFTVVAVLFLVLGGVVSTFAPASLSISIIPLSQPCDIMTVDFSNACTSFPSTALANLATHVVLTQSAMLPPSSPCSNCTYNVVYFAPALTCSEINMTSSPFHPDPVHHVVLWNGTFAPNQVNQTFDIYLMSRSGNPFTGNFSDPQIIMCTLQNATYKANIDHRNGTRVTAEMDIVPFYDQYTESVNVTEAYVSISRAFAEFMSGSVELVPSQEPFKMYDMTSNTFVAYTGWITCGDDVSANCTRNIDLLTALPILMQHMSVGLLAGSVTIDNRTSSLSQVPDGRCLNESAVYVYDRVRLLAVYGSALLVTLYCVAKAIHSVRVGQGGTFTFSNLVYAIMSPEMIEISNGQELPGDTVIHAVRGRFVPG
ncbi:hypothetical protein BD410DRAFT_808733 [Rickenella mellea]|uniref:Transmembrane protein n=1 Tax=Rickenella mellea TaxID=50990 RepID=A0A4Y7PKV8_9AGAM|nr:hypothetical protein BD410DRAFT_808733 [Rickenella mellea]